MNQKHNRPRCFLLATLLAAFPMTDALAQNISFGQKQTTLKAVIAEIEKQSDLSVDYDASVVDASKVVTTQPINGNPEAALSAMLKGTGYTCEVQGKHIIIKKENAQKSSSKGSRTVTGTIIDDFGEPVVGATVIAKGTTQGTVTDIDGNYSLEVPASCEELQFSYIGYSAQTIALGDKTSVNVTMSEDSQLLNDVVVVGYGTQKKVNLTGAVSVIDGKDLNARPVTNAAMALQGADPSLLLTTGNGSIAGDQYSVSIRGSVSLNSGDPLVLIDGIEGSLSQVNPNDIESISVLKDASACAVYGAKASAGVILVNTKSGSEGSTKITYNGRFSLSQNTTTTDFMTSSYDYVSLTNEFYNYLMGHGAWEYTDAQIQMMYDRRNDKTEDPSRPWVLPDETGKYTYVYLGNYDWYDYLFNKTRPETEHNVTVRGGNDKVTYYASGRYLYREGLFAGKAQDTYNGYSFRSKIDAKLTGWLTYSNNVSYERTDYQYGGFWEQDGSSGNTSSGILYNLTQNVGPNLVPYNPDGTIAMVPGFMADATSPLFSGRGGVYMDGRNHNSNVNNYVTLTNRFTAKITDDLKFIADYTYRRRDKVIANRSVPTANCYDNVNKRMYQGNGLSGGIFSNGSVYDFYQENRYFLDGQVVNAFFQYNHSFAGKHNVAATLGGNFDNYRSSALLVNQKGSLSEALSYINMANGEIAKASETNSAYRTLGFFGRVNYDYAGRYLLELSGRYDGSSRFPVGHRWGFFPSASGGWRISEEPFWDNIKDVVTNAKLRMSYGTLGNQQVNDYYYWDKISTGQLSYTFDGSNKAGYASASSPVSSNLTWETVVSKNIGLDLGFFNGRLTVTADYFIRDTENMLTKAMTLPVVYGETAPKENAADLQTKGYELAISWKDNLTLGGKPFSYSVTATLGDYQTHITRFDNENGQLSDHYVGERLGDIWGYRTDGLFKTDADAAAYEAKYNSSVVNKGIFACKAPYNHLMAGDIIYKNLNGDDAINAGSSTLADPGDREIIGNSLPRYNYALKGDVSWNGIDLSVFFQGVGKIDWMPSGNCIYFWGPYSYQRPTFITKDFDSLCWSSESGADNSKAVFPRKRGKIASSGNLVTSDYFLQNAAYLRLKNLTLGYTLPFKTKALEKVRIYFSGENLFYFSPLTNACKTIDPEVATTTSADDCLYPYAKTFSLGIDVTF